MKIQVYSNFMLMFFFFGLVSFFTSQSTAMVISELSVHITTLFPGQAWISINQYLVHILSLVTDNNPSWIRGREENGCRNHFMIVSVKVRGQAGINSQPLDLQSHTYLQWDMLLTAICSPVLCLCDITIITRADPYYDTLGVTML